MTDLSNDTCYANIEPSTGINTPQLQDEMNTAGLPVADAIESDSSNVYVYYSSALTSDQQTTLTTVIANHLAIPTYVTIALQNDINTLIGYLNNSNMTIANTARAVIIQNLAPRMSQGLIETINAQIHAITGT